MLLADRLGQFLSKNEVRFVYWETVSQSLSRNLREIVAASNPALYDTAVRRLHTEKGKGKFGATLSVPEVLELIVYAARFPGLRSSPIQDPEFIKSALGSIGGVCFIVIFCYRLPNERPTDHIRNILSAARCHG